MFRLRTCTPAVAITAATIVLLTGCGDLSDSPPDPSALPGCLDACTARAADPIFPTPVAVPTLDPALVAWRNTVHASVAKLTKDLGAIDGCGGQYGDDRADCRSKITALMTDARAMRDALDPHAVPPDAVDDAGKISDALDVILQGCTHADGATGRDAAEWWRTGLMPLCADWRELVAHRGEHASPNNPLDDPAPVPSFDQVVAELAEERGE